jgi:D-alanine-D-alanine ligase
LLVLPIAEIDFSAFEDIKDRLCTYESKFVPQSKAFNLAKMRLPASLTEDEQKSLVKITRDCYREAYCRDYARLDCRLRDGIFYILDINHNADITPGFSAALSAELAGLSYGKFGSLLVNLAAQRHPVFGVPVLDGLSLEKELSSL